MGIGTIIILVVVGIVGTAVSLLYDKRFGFFGTLAAVLIVMAGDIALDSLKDIIMDDVSNPPSQSESLPEYEDGSNRNDGRTSSEIKQMLSSLSVGDCFTFGSYEQDGKTSNGPEPIEWRVLSKGNDRALVLAEYCLDCVQYNSEFIDVVWRTCSLREWLNDDFYSAAFSGTEKNFILSTNVANPGNPKYPAEGGDNTNDRVFCLSIEEAEGYLKINADRIAQFTRYAESTGASGWWLRTPGKYHNLASAVLESGSVSAGGRDVNRTDVGVRPALYISLD